MPYMSVHFLPVVLLTILSGGLLAQELAPSSSTQVPAFKGHRIGETAEEFFAIDGGGAPEECQQSLNDPKFMKEAEKGRAKYPFGSVNSIMAKNRAESCHELLAVVTGHDGTIGAGTGERQDGFSPLRECLLSL